jgi:hypothetical protein
LNHSTAAKNDQIRIAATAKAGLQLETPLPPRPKNEKLLVHSRSPGAKPIHVAMPPNATTMSGATHLATLANPNAYADKATPTGRNAAQAA